MSEPAAFVQEWRAIVAYYRDVETGAEYAVDHCGVNYRLEPDGRYERVTTVPAKTERIEGRLEAVIEQAVKTTIELAKREDDWQRRQKPNAP